ncbi:U32 family peptidase [Niameybacter massiliensis]|uniref:U32 family peptidase n=1 Tax=Niameybacter massiliensis TaxID=1658108 RepID=UPI0006B4422B|nr:U32 family peptidase [Niameybacter massiliensis]
MRQVELLAPVGKFENALAAIENGANAIFVGGKVFNARQFADNFDEDELEKIVNYCKLRGVKTHITVNTLIKEDELPELMQYLESLARLGVDAVIVQDLGVAYLVKRYFPQIELHASTQMSAHSLEDVLFLKAFGFKRVVLAREMQLEEIKQIKDAVDIEIETFIHGALCYSYSGQCLFSSQIGGRSGNRGRCAQPCRMTYDLLEDGEEKIKSTYFLSPKDLYSLSFLPQLIEIGIDSFKMEGRMKSPEYVASVTRVYRKYVDLALKDPKHYKVEQEDIEMLQSIFNRGGFSEGYYFKKAGLDMMTEKTPKNIGLRVGHIVKYDKRNKLATIYTEKTLNPGDGLEIWNKKKHTGTGISKVYPGGQTFTVRVEDWVDEKSPVYLSKNNTLLKALRKTYEKAQRKVPVQGKLVGKLGEPVSFTLFYEGLEATALGEILEAAQSAPLTKEVAIEKLSKLGTTSFELTHVDAEWDDDVYMTISKLNELRREAVAHLEALICESGTQKTYAPYTPDSNQRYEGKPSYHAQVRTIEQLQVVLDYPQLQAVYWEWQYNDRKMQEALELCEAKGKPMYIVFPAITKEKALERIKKSLPSFEASGLTGYVIRTLGVFYILMSSHKEKVIDYNLNVMNNEAVYQWSENGVTRITTSAELAKEELESLEGPLETIIYGRLPVMTTEQCVLGNHELCQKKKQTGKYSLRDRKGAIWPLTTDCVGCKMQILMHEPLLIEPEKYLQNMSLMVYRIWFTEENAKETKEVLESLLNGKKVTFASQKASFLKPID